MNLEVKGKEIFILRIDYNPPRQEPEVRLIDDFNEACQAYIEITKQLKDSIRDHDDYLNQPSFVSLERIKFHGYPDDGKVWDIRTEQVEHKEILQNIVHFVKFPEQKEIQP